MSPYVQELRRRHWAAVLVRRSMQAVRSETTAVTPQSQMSPAPAPRRLPSPIAVSPAYSPASTRNGSVRSTSAGSDTHRRCTFDTAADGRNEHVAGALSSARTSCAEPHMGAVGQQHPAFLMPDTQDNDQRSRLSSYFAKAAVAPDERAPVTREGWSQMVDQRQAVRHPGALFLSWDDVPGNPLEVGAFVR